MNTPQHPDEYGAQVFTTELTEEQKKKQTVGICCFNLLGLVSTAAFICGIYSYAQCDFVNRYVTLVPEYASEGDDLDSQISAACTTLGYNKISQQSQMLCESILGNRKIGFRYWQATIPVDQKICAPYTQLTPWGWVTPNFDSAFKASSAFSILGYIFGGAAWFTLSCSIGCRMDQNRLKGTSCYFWMATFFTGLSLLMFKSNVCEKGFFAPYFVNPYSSNYTDAINAYDSIIEDVTCELSFGSKMAVSATVMYFLCSMMALCAVVPFYEQRYYQGDYEAAQKA